MQTASTDWNPSLYLKFGRERTQPVRDLVSRIELSNPEQIIDIGCGPGNSTAVLADRWPQSQITGLDNSSAMIEQAQKSNGNIEWILSNAAVDKLPQFYDLIFSNAAYQWMGDIPSLFKKLKGSLKEGGVFAAQVTLFNKMPMHGIIKRVSERPQWGFKKQQERFIIQGSQEYYDILSALYNHVELWVTDYVHIMESHQAILEMMRSTALRPYLSQLKGSEERATYEREILEGIKKDYPMSKNGKVLYTFKRVFFIAN